VSSLVAFCLFAGVLLVEAGHLVLAGALVAFAAQVKLLPAVAPAVLVAQERWRAAGWVVVGAAFILLATFACGAPGEGASAPAHLWTSWLANTVAPVASDDRSWVTLEYTPWNHSLVAMLNRLFDPAIAAHYGVGRPWIELPPALLRVASWGIGLTGVGLSLSLARRGRHLPEVGLASFGLAWIALNLMHPQTWTHHLLAFALCVPLLGTDVAFGERRRGRALASIPFVAFALLFTLPSVAMMILPAELATGVRRLQFEAGRYALPTITIVGVWTALTWMAWIRSADPDAHGACAERDGAAPGPISREAA